MVSKISEFGSAYAAEQLRRSRHPLRRLIKKFYLDRVLRELRGPTIDFGCGAGQLLARLPADSVGLEVNPHLVQALQQAGMNARLYDAYSDDFSLSQLEVGRYESFTISHVLEHFDDTAAVMRKLWRACARLGVTTVVAVVPGAKGYAYDSTHKTFVTQAWLRRNCLAECEGFVLDKAGYFPIDAEAVGNWFVFHELHLVYRRKPHISGPDTFWARRIAPLLRPQFMRFLAVGAANTGFAILVFWAMLWAGLAVPLASLASIVVGILISFTTQSRFVFDNRDPWKLLPYFIVWSILYAFNLGLIWLLMRCGLDAYAAGFLSTPATVLLSYFLQKAFVFHA